MSPIDAVDSLMVVLGYGKIVPIVLAGVGFFSAVATVYPTEWPGAAIIHKCALLVGKAAPATPAAGS
jgi:hypothetical protein